MKICEIKTKISSLERPPFFMGVALKKDFGKALKSVSCINHFYKCDGCFAARDCLYHKLMRVKMSIKNLDLTLISGSKIMILIYFCLMISAMSCPISHQL